MGAALQVQTEAVKRLTEEKGATEKALGAKQELATKAIAGKEAAELELSKVLGTAAGAVPTERQSVPRTVVMPAILAELRDNIMFTPVTKCWPHSSFCSARNAE